MASRTVLILSVFAFLSCECVGEAKDELYRGVFPDDFIWGCSSSAYQIEGAWNVDGKGVNIWDTFTHIPGKILGNDTGDIACDSYNKYREDVKMLKSLGKCTVIVYFCCEEKGFKEVWQSRDSNINEVLKQKIYFKHGKKCCVIRLVKYWVAAPCCSIHAKGSKLYDFLQ